MTDTDDAGIPGDVADAFERHDAFAHTGSADGRDSSDRFGDAYALDSTVFDVTATATPTDSEKAAEFAVTVAVPTLPASVADPSEVADVVADGWFETLERRLEDAFDVAKTSYGDEPTLDRGDGVITVEFRYESWTASDGVEDAKVLAEYVEGTFAQGLIPGYEYVGAAGELRSSAAQNAGDADDPGGTPL